jgi:hypothetical protein
MPKVTVSILEGMFRSIMGILSSRLFAEFAKTILE